MPIKDVPTFELEITIEMVLREKLFQVFRISFVIHGSLAKFIYHQVLSFKIKVSATKNFLFFNMSTIVWFY